MTLQILVLLLVGALLIPVAMYYFVEYPEVRSWFRSKRRSGRLSAETMTMLQRWYAGRPCAMCGHAISPIQGNSRPGFLDRSTHRTRGWDEVPEADLPRAVEQYHPVCAGCVTAEAFRALYPDLVVDRAATPLRDSSMH